jgi:rubrerythrin
MWKSHWKEENMATTIGTESSIDKLVTDLIYLEHDAIAAYDTTIERLDDPEAKGKISEFRADHRQHLQVLEEMARELGIDASKGGDMKKMLTTGKVALADMVGNDEAILKAMKTNEDDTVTAYERASSHGEAIDKSKAFFAKAAADERRHREWMEQRSHRRAA